MEDIGPDLAFAGEATYGEWPCIKGLESEVVDRGVEAWEKWEPPSAVVNRGGCKACSRRFGEG